jgi:hypothetical protein
MNKSTSSDRSEVLQVRLWRCFCGLRLHSAWARCGRCGLDIFFLWRDMSQKATTCHNFTGLYKAYVSGISPQNIAKKMIQYLHFRILKFPLTTCCLCITHRIHVWYIYIYANIGGILMVNVTIYSIHGSDGL